MVTTGHANGSGNNEVGDCIDCVVGKFSEATGSDEEGDCIVCEQGKYNDVTGLHSESDCKDCGLGKVSATNFVLTFVLTLYLLSLHPLLCSTTQRAEARTQLQRARQVKFLDFPYQIISVVRLTSGSHDRRSRHIQ